MKGFRMLVLAASSPWRQRSLDAPRGADAQWLRQNDRSARRMWLAIVEKLRIVTLLSLLIGVEMAAGSEQGKQAEWKLPAVSKPDSGQPKPITTKLDVGPVAIDVDIAKPVFSLSDVVEISVTMTARPHVQVDWPKIAEAADVYKVLGTSMDGPDRLDKFTLRRWYARLEPLRLGPFQVEPLTVRYKSGTDDWQTGEIPVPKLEIVPGPSSSEDLASLRSLPVPPHPATELPPAELLPRVLRWVGIALTIGVILAAMRSRFRPAAGMHSPQEDCLAALARLEDRGVGQEGARAFIADTTSLVRGYLESAYSFEASRQSTQEFLADEKVHAMLTQGQKQALAEFLVAADVEKFASRPPSMDEANLCLRRARAFLAGERRK